MLVSCLSLLNVGRVTAQQVETQSIAAGWGSASADYETWIEDVTNVWPEQDLVMARPTPKNIVLFMILGAVIVVYGVKRAIDASGINAEPPLVTYPPLPVPPKRQKPPKPANASSNGSSANYSQASADTGGTGTGTGTGGGSITLSPFHVTCDANGQYIGTTLFSAEDLNSFYGTNSNDGVFVPDSGYCDPDGYDYLCCETFIIQSADGIGGEWTDGIQVYIWNNQRYCSASTYTMTSDVPIESVLVTKPDSTQPDHAVRLQSLVDFMSPDPTASMKIFRMEEGAPTHHGLPVTNSQ